MSECGTAGELGDASLACPYLILGELAGEYAAQLRHAHLLLRVAHAQLLGSCHVHAADAHRLRCQHHKVALRLASSQVTQPVCSWVMWLQRDHAVVPALV